MADRQPSSQARRGRLRRRSRRPRAFRAERELARANEELASFTAGAAHDLQGPMRKIVALANRQLALPGRKEAVYRDLARIRDLAQRMRELVDYLLSYEQAKTAKLQPQDNDAQDAVEDVLADLRAKIERNRGRVHLERLPVIYGDPVQLRQVLRHLLENALKFHAPGVTPVVRVSGRTLPDGAGELCVEDDGIGIEPRHFDQIFEPFKRLNCHDAYDGNGLGLAICQRLMSRHGGRIAVASVMGKGTRFTVRFPARRS